MWTFSPGIGYQVAERWTAGLNLTYGKFKAAYRSTTTYGGGPFVRYTHPIYGIFSVFGQLEGSYIIQDYSANPTYKETRIALFPAIEMNMRKGFALNFGLGGLQFSSNRIEGRSGSYSSFDIYFGSNASVGVSKRFGGKK
jgi:hypothetical protein